MEYYIKKGFKLNPNGKVVNGITKAVERNNGECPCSGNTGKTHEDRCCPCRMYRIDGHCCCGLYVTLNHTEDETVQ